MSGQPAAARVIADIEAWWGESLSDGLIDRITSAPFDHLIAFHEEGNDLQDLYESGHLPPLAAGELRPVWGEALEPTSFNYRTAAKLLLYVDSVVEDSHRLEPFNVVEIEDARHDHVFVRRSIREDLQWLFYHRPLIDDGSILFTAKFRGLSHFGFWDSFTGDSETPAGPEWAVSGNVLAAMEGTATPIAQSAAHEAAYRSMLDGHRLADGRSSELTTLARVPLPGLKGAALQSVVHLRSTADEFAEWRSQLRTALSTVSELPDTEHAALEAAAIVKAELSQSTQQLTKAMDRSPALSALRAASEGLGLTALGAAGSVGVATVADPNDPKLLVGGLVGAVPGAVVNVRDAGRAFVEASRARKTGRAVWNILGYFEPDVPHVHNSALGT